MVRFLLGLVFVIVGGETTIRSLSFLSDHLGIRRSFIGLVVIAFGTSLPEFVVSLAANLKGISDVAVGNILGSFTANLALILGISCLLKPIPTNRDMAKREGPIMLVSVLLIFILSSDGTLSRLDGVLCLIMFSIFLVKIRVKTPSNGPHSEPDRNVVSKTAILVLLTLLGFILLIKGADLMVDGAKLISKKWHIAEIIVGSVMVAIGTSIPELTATLTATIKGENEIAIGNVVGSNIFNMLFILGIVSLVGPLPIGREALDKFFPFMLGLSTVFMSRATKSGKLGRSLGITFLVSYILFVHIL